MLPRRDIRLNLQYGDDCAAALDVVRQAFYPRASSKTLKSIRSGDVDKYAAQVAALDLVVTSSNAAAQLAGALGVPVFCLLRRKRSGAGGAVVLVRGTRPHALVSVGPPLFVQAEDKSWLRTLRDVGIAVLDAVAASGASIDRGHHYLRGLAKGFEESGTF